MSTTYILILVISLLAIAISLIVINFEKKNKDQNEIKPSNNTPNSLSLQNDESLELAFNKVTDIASINTNDLVEIKDKQLLSRIDDAIPKALRTVEKTKNAKYAKEVANKMKDVYHVVIPKNMELVDAKNVNGAKRAIYRNPLDKSKRIKGQALLEKVENPDASKLAKLNNLNAVMDVGSMVVGQYYMAEINQKLEDISDSVSEIANTQKNEYKSKVLSLVAETQKLSTFQVEVLEKENIRNRKLAHLDTLEHECSELLGQANLELDEIVKKKNLEYEKYEKELQKAETWYKFQQALLSIMKRMSELDYSLNMGEISLENSNYLLSPYYKQAQNVITELNKWHKDNIKRLEIDSDKSRRKKRGFEKFVMYIPSLINDDWNYDKIPKNIIEKINTQSKLSIEDNNNSNDLFKEDVELIAQNGKLYYLPKK